MAAATADALASLRRQVLESLILPDFTVRQLIDRADGVEILEGTVRAAQQIGGNALAE